MDSISVKFNLNKNKIKKSNICPIRMQINLKGTKIRLSIGEKVNINHWSSNKQRVNKNLKKEPYNFHKEINQKLEQYEIKTKQLYYNCVAKEVPFSRLLIQDHLTNRLDEDLQEKKAFLPAFDEFLRYKKNEHTKSTGKTYRAAKNKLIAYEKYNNVKLTFNDFNDKFFIEFQEYIFNVKNHQTNYFVNLMKKYIAVLNWSFDKGYHQKIDFRKWKLKEPDPQIIYLTFDELNLLYHCELERDRHIKTRDFLIFQCDTGLRISDLKSLSDANFHIEKIKHKGKIVETHTLFYTSVKTNTKAVLPLTKRAVLIYEKYLLKHKRKIFPCFSDQKYNEYIKEVGEIVGINKATEKYYYSGSKKTKQVEPKYKFMSSKIGRKTFITLHYLKNGKPKTIMGMAGLSTDKAFNVYCQDSIENKLNYIMRVNEEIEL